MKAKGKHKDIRSRQARQSSYHYRMIIRAVKVVEKPRAIDPV